jgi:hypothetical protein
MTKAPRLPRGPIDENGGGVPADRNGNRAMEPCEHRRTSGSPRLVSEAALVSRPGAQPTDLILQFEFLELQPGNLDVTGTRPAQLFLDPAVEKLVLL